MPNVIQSGKTMKVRVIQREDGWVRADMAGRKDIHNLCNACTTPKCDVRGALEMLSGTGYEPVMWQCRFFSVVAKPIEDLQHEYADAEAPGPEVGDDPNVS